MLKKARAAMANEDDAAAAGKGPGKGGRKAAEASRDTSQQILDSSRSIWLAGLGAFSRVQAEGARMFEGLVKQGEALESKTRRAAVDTAAAATDAAKAKVKEVKDGVGGTWDKLEQVFEARVARALAKLGVHTQSDVERLAERVDALSAAVNELIKAGGGKAPTGKAPAVKRARKPKTAPADAASATTAPRRTRGKRTAG
ncbi:MAG: phasin family protein [Burkholderiales bacterium]|nr:phasin family protein [Burkholderiales bacterium]